ncbi:MAG: hypothetical protein JF606_24820 [Burkholderiales bacterium]|nr:hypothetical protein [Burkholderiales bacterium]
MSAIDAISREAVGAGFSIPAMLRARNLSLEAVGRIAQAIWPGMTQGQATGCWATTRRATRISR